MMRILGYVFELVGLILIGISGGVVTYAGVPCVDRSLGGLGKMVHEVVEFADSGTHRETVEERIESHKQKPDPPGTDYKATGLLKCAGGEATANLVVKNDVIVTVAHMFVDRDTCMKKRDVKMCTFQVEGQPAVPLDSMESSGSQCPAPFDENHDWAIIKLKSPISGVKPYAMKSSGRYFDPQSVIAVGNSSVDFRRKDPKTGKVINPKHVQDCVIRRTYPRYDPIVFNSNCDGSYGKSGGAVLGLENGLPVIIGMSTGSPFSTAESLQETRTGKPVRKNYEDNKWSDTGISITGRFYEELQRITR